MDFQGFQNILPVSVIILIIAAFMLLSWYAYRKFDRISPVGRWVLIALRSSALTLLLLLLLNPYFFSSREVELKPNVAVFLDNSESIGITKENYDGLDSYRKLLNSLNFNAISGAEFQFYSIGEKVEEFHPDSLTAREIQTNLSQPIQSILEMAEEVQAAIIISDGIITFGRNPSVNAYNSSIPIYTIGIGDTAKVRDISVTNVLTNATGYTNTNHIIDAEISQTGFANNTISISLLSDEEILAQKELSFETDDQVKNVQFEHELQEKGLQQFEIRTEPLSEEWTEVNNSRSFSIDVLDSKVKILHVAFEIHPDVKAVRRIISQDINNELATLTWLGGNRFVEELPDENDFNLIIVHGEPPSNQSFDFLNTLDETPSVFFGSSVILNSQFEYRERLKLVEPRANRVSPASLIPVLSSDEHPVLELPEINLDETPPLFSPIRTQLSAIQSTTLYSINYDGVDTGYPAIVVLEQGNLRRAHVVPSGWYRMLQSTNSGHQEFTASLLSNLISWTASDPDNRKLRIVPAKQTFSTSEFPLLNGSLQNERGEPEENGIIEIQLEMEGQSIRTFNMEKSGRGNYRLELPRLSEGLYKYTATARKGNRLIESQNGEFLVSNSSSELANTIRNDALLHSIANNSSGLYFPYEHAAALWDSLDAANVLQARTETIENYLFPVRNFYWFLVVIFLLGAEWLLRKYYSLP